LCPAKVWTIGWGHTRGVNEGDEITLAEAKAFFDADLEEYEQGVLKLTSGMTLTQGQFDALVSFAYNFGCSRLAKSTLLRKLVAGDKLGAANEFLKWIYAGPRVLRGLERRRAAERALFLEEA
jgi:lysozyme